MTQARICTELAVLFMGDFGAIQTPLREMINEPHKPESWAKALGARCGTDGDAAKWIFPDHSEAVIFDGVVKVDGLEINLEERFEMAVEAEIAASIPQAGEPVSEDTPTPTEPASGEENPAGAEFNLNL